ncbi:MAG TPA: hypothetical protein VMU47_10930, partial [Caldimonas sp.]|nr:hypothetical protein [Caldimonas sp.]
MALRVAGGGGGSPYNPAAVAITGGTITGVTGVPYILAQASPAAATPADTSEDTLATITVPANALGSAGALRIVTHWSCNNNGNVKTVRVRYSGAAGAVFGQLAVTSSPGGSISLFITN